MQSVKGIYTNGKIELLEDVDIKKTCKVIVTFVEEDDVQQLRNYAADSDAFGFWTANEEDLYQDYLKK